MGVEFLNCDACDETFCDNSDFGSCSCGKCFCEDCTDDLISTGFKLECDFESCYFCTNKSNLKEVSDEEFLKWLKEITGKTKTDYIQFLIDKGDLE